MQGIIVEADRRSEGAQELKVGSTWDQYWSRFDAARFEALYERLAVPARWYRRPFTCGPREEVAIIKKALGDLRGKQTLELGSGIGWTSLWLSRAGAMTTIADVSDKALELSRRAFARASCAGSWTQTSIFAPESGLEGQDLVFNSGLIEHFHRDDQLRLLASMKRLVRPGGHVIVIAPYAGGRLYVWAKRQLERLGKWSFGDEFPLLTMRDLGHETGLETIAEVTAKPGDQMNFLAGVHPRTALLGKLGYLATLGDATPLWRWCLGDSMLATTFRRPER